MDATTIPFAAKVGVIRSETGALTLPGAASNHNHLETVHASAQFTLAEIASGDALQRHFPELADKVIPLMRDSQIKFRAAAKGTLTAHPHLAAEDAERFLARFERKGRATIPVQVELQDEEGVTTCSATFTWFVQGIE